MAQRNTRRQLKMAGHTILWKRLDADGRDACRLLAVDGGGHRLEGHAIFLCEGQVCSLAYRVTCDADWTTRSARVEGLLLGKDLALDIARRDDGWTINGEPQPAIAGLIDLDLGFTPATNLVAIRRLRLLEQRTEVAAPAAFLEFPEVSPVRVEQFYRAIAADRFAYRSPAYQYEAELTVTAEGFVANYPDLWMRIG